MAGAARTALILGGLLAVGIGVAIWAATSSDEDDGARRPVESPAAGAPAASNAGAAPSAAKTKRLVGTAVVFGEIRRSAGKTPVVGQDVVLAPERGEPWIVATGADGAFRFDHVPHGGPYELSVTAKGCGTIRLPGIALDRNEQRNVGTLRLDPSVKLTVRVRANADVPVAGAVVEAFPITPSVDYDWSKALAQMGQASISVAKSTTDAKGEALFPEMAVGEWTFTARKDGFATGGARSVNLRSDETPQPVTIHLWPGYRLEGRVLAAGKEPVAGALVMAGAVNSAWDLDSAPLRARATTDAEGRYAFAALPSGQSQLWAARAGGVPSPQATVRVPLVARYDIVLVGGGVLAGTVTEKETGKPVEGATVRASSWEYATARGGETVTDASGKYALEMAAGVVNELSVEKDGLVQVPLETNVGSQRQAVLHEGETAVRDLQMRRGARLHGVVKGPDGPVGGARVAVYVSRPGLDDLEKHATTASDGTYDFPSIEKGVALVLATKDGLYLEGAPADEWNAIQHADEAKALKVEIGESGETTKDLELKRGSLVEGRVDGPDGAPLAGARVSAPGVADAPPSGADGAFQLEGVTPGPAVQLACVKEGLSAFGVAPIEVVAGEPVKGVVLRMTREPVVRGAVTSKSAAALRDVVVLLAYVERGNDDESPWNERWRWQNATRVAVRADGGFETPMQLVPPGRLLVRVESVDAPQTDAAPIDVVEGKDVYEANVVLEEGKDLAGKVAAKGGAAVAGADVSIAPHHDDSGNQSYYGYDESPTVWAVSDAAGEFRVPHLMSGKYDVRAQAPGFVVGQAVADLAGSGNVVVELSPEMTIEGTVAYVDGRPVEGVELQAVVESGGSSARAVFGGTSQEQRRSAVADAKGAFQLKGLADGRYTVRMSLPWGARINVRTKDVENVAAGTTGLKIVCEEGGTIAGHVIDAARKPVTHAYLNASPAGVENSNDDQHDAESRPDGSFTLTGLGAGPYDVHVSVDDAAGNYRPKSVVGVAVGAKDLEIVLEDGLTIAGVIVDDVGKPLAQTALEFTSVGTEDGDSFMAYADSAGKFSLAGLAPGAYRPSIANYGGSNQSWTLASKSTVAAGTTNLRLVAVKGLSIAGVVVDEDGKPLERVWVHVVDTKDPEASRDGQTNASGAFEVAGLDKARSYVVRATMQNRVGAMVGDVQVGATGVKLVLAKGLTSSGRALDAAGKPLSRCRLAFSRAGQEEDTDTKSAQTDADGAFTVAGLAPGVYDAKALLPKAVGGNEWKPCGALKAGDSNVELRVAQ
jgi:uncharacterized GH25 family protein